MLLYSLGLLLCVGLWTRLSGAITAAVFTVGIIYHGSYMLTYTNYLGEAVVSMILGGGMWSLDHYRTHHSSHIHALAHRLEPYAFPLLRALFGISVIYAAYFAKFMHSQLALDVIAHYHLTDFFPFPPLFTVLGASIVEVLIGLFIVFGFEIRHTALFFLFWIGLSLVYFGESVWPHLVLVGVLIALFCHGYDKYSFQGYFFKHHDREPVL
jgi:uncharacterized membrane protein YphA (DoxX/SURF4 family)